MCTRALEAPVCPGQLSEQEVENAIGDVKALALDRNGKKSTAWAAMEQEGNSGLLALYALALRRSCAALEPDIAGRQRAAYATPRAQLATQLEDERMQSDKRQGASAAGTLAMAVLGSHTLRCYSRLLSTSTESLAQQQPHNTARSRSLQQLKGLLEESRQAMYVVGSAASKSNLRGDQRDYPATEFRDSGLLEHWGCGLLRLASTEGGEDDAATALRRMSLQLTVLRFHSGKFLYPSPSLFYLLSSYMVCLCAPLDRGATYGMLSGPGAAMAPLWSTAGRRLRPGASDEVDVGLAKLSLQLWTEDFVQQRKRARRDAQPWPQRGQGSAGQQPQARPQRQQQQQQQQPGAGQELAPREGQDEVRDAVSALERLLDQAVDALGRIAGPGEPPRLPSEHVLPLYGRGAFAVGLRLAASCVRALKRAAPQAPSGAAGSPPAGSSATGPPAVGFQAPAHQRQRPSAHAGHGSGPRQKAADVG